MEQFFFHVRLTNGQRETGKGKGGLPNQPREIKEEVAPWGRRSLYSPLSGPLQQWISLRAPEGPPFS